MKFDYTKWTVGGFIRSFFPFQLILGQLKYNLISMFYWALLFAIIADSFGSAFGVPFLFLSPEYQGEVNNWAFFLLGFSFGGFTMAFNTYSYIKLGPRYQFLAAVSRPFFKFCMNNSLIPITFFVFYLYRMISFQNQQELTDWKTITMFSLSVFVGALLFILLSIFYFFPTTRNKHVEPDEETQDTPISSVLNKQLRWYNYFRTERKRPFIYIGKHLKLYQSRNITHLDKEVIERVFAQNRINATIFEILTISTFFILSFFRDWPVFETPAAMSIVLLLTMIHMIFSAMMSWFHRWTYPIIFIAIFSMNYLSTHTGMFKYTNYAYGLDYSPEKLQEFSVERIRNSGSDTTVHDNSKKEFISLLENWKIKTKNEKPKLIIINTSGGGSRSALWTLTVLQNCEKGTRGKLTSHIQMITGASGGMVGAAYFRELIHLHRNNKINDLFNSSFRKNLGKDLLNKLAFSVSTNDMFVRFQTFEHNGHSYTKDRGYAFEEQLHENTENILRHDLGYYTQPEKDAKVPVMIFSPTIANDGRRLLISSQSLRFLTERKNSNEERSNSYENIDYQSFFAKNDPQKIRFSSVLRANATFPFIMPMVTMPTVPEMQLMDAGIRDNYGTRTTIEYLTQLTEWIKENTSGVIIIEIRDTKRILNNESYHSVSMLDKITLPFGNIYSNFPRTQDFDQEQLLEAAAKSFPFSLDVITFNLREHSNDRISLSWHLTAQEKYKIERAFYSKANQNAYRKLLKSL
ncbi:MAG: patatin-like phospholipase family protein [Bacteroidetes bacterium]|nr:MAG: patatin-like phospholipase family protein [Bacteroidota bacterium]